VLNPYDTVRTNLPVADPLLKFVNESAFAQNGGIVTDLDGTALHEDAERVYIPKAVGRPVGPVFALKLARRTADILALEIEPKYSKQEQRR
jgi:hypothetical protein